jgi:hypothetical protein
MGTRRQRLVALAGLIGVMILLAAPLAAGPAAAQPSAQGAFPTPTPGPDGRIVYIVKDGDSAWTIAAVAGLTLEELMALNGLQANDYITPGMELVLGLAGPAQPTAGAISAPSPTPVPPTPTPTFGTGEICVLLFVDQNGNGQLDDGEPALPDGQVNIADVGGAVAGEHKTDTAPDGYCFADLQSGDYNVSAAVPPDYNPTTAMNLPLRLEAGEIKYVEFAAQPSAAIAGNGSLDSRNRSLLLGLVGIGLLLAAVALGVYATRLGRRSPSSLR